MLHYLKVWLIFKVTTPEPEISVTFALSLHVRWWWYFPLDWQMKPSILAICPHKWAISCINALHFNAPLHWGVKERTTMYRLRVDTYTFVFHQNDLSMLWDSLSLKTKLLCRSLFNMFVQQLVQKVCIVSQVQGRYFLAFYGFDQSLLMYQVVQRADELAELFKEFIFGIHIRLLFTSS